jgi:hypothetical protein
VQINGSLTEEITPMRELRQGDPLSFYLFLYLAESFSKPIKEAILKHDAREF